MNTAFYWSLRSEGEIREYLLIDRFLFLARRIIGKGQLILTNEWADSDDAERRAIASTERVEKEGLVLHGSVRVHFTSHSEEDLMRICDDNDGMAAVKMMALAETYGKALT